MCALCGNPFHLNDAATTDPALTGAGPTQSFSIAQAAAQITRANYHWGPTLGAATGPISFGFRSTAPNSSDPTETSTFSRFTAQEMAAAESVMREWAAVANITFSEVNPGGYTNSATILFSNYNSSTDGAQAYAYFPSSNNQSFGSSQGDVWLNTRYENTISLPFGSYDYLTILHEVGHSIGLQHPGDYNAGPGQTISYSNSAPYIEDTRQYTVMSYWDASNTGANHVYNGRTIYASTPLLDDIAAAQRLYGANMNYASGNTTYGFNSNADAAYRITSSTQQVVYCIWDGGGNDTLDCSGYANNQLINLTPGGFSNIGALTLNVSIAAGAIVEQAIGGTGDDILVGNAANNVINGGAGTDIFYLGGLRSQYQSGKNPDGSARLADLRGGSPDGTDSFYNVEYFHFADATYTLAQVLNNPPVLTLVAPSIAPTARGQVFLMSDLFSASDADGDPLTYYFNDMTSDPYSGHFEVGGVARAAGVQFSVTQAQLNQVTFVAGNWTADMLSIMVGDGIAFTNRAVQINAAPDAVPVGSLPLGASVTATSRGQVYQASQLFSASDADGDALTYAFIDFTSGNGSFSVNGQMAAAGTPKILTAAQFAQTTFQVGDSGSDHIRFAVNDHPNADANSVGWVIRELDVGAHVNQAPVASLPLGASVTAASRGQVYQASDLFSATDADGDTLTYAFIDFTSGNGSFSVNGQTIASGTPTVLTAAQLAQTTFQVGNSGSDHIRMAVNDLPNANINSAGWVIRDFDVAAPANHAPVASTPLGTNITATSPSQVYQASQLFSATDSDGDTLTYAVIDFTSGNGSFNVNGQPVAAGTPTIITAAQFAQMTFQVGSSGSDHLRIAVNDLPNANANSAGWVYSDFDIAATAGMPPSAMHDWHI